MQNFVNLKTSRKIRFDDRRVGKFPLNYSCAHIYIKVKDLKKKYLKENKKNRLFSVLNVAIGEEGLDILTKDGEVTEQTADRKKKKQDRQFFDLLSQRELLNSHGTVPHCFKLLVCVAIYNEHLDDLEKTIEGIRENMYEFKIAGVPTENIGIVIIFDGIEHIDESIIENNDLLNTVVIKKLKEIRDNLKKNKSVYNEYLLKNASLLYATKRNLQLDNGYFQSRSLKIFKNTQQGSGQPANKQPDDSFIIMFSFKYQNAQKLNSHKWFLQGFCKEFKPIHVAFLDCGAKPERNALFKLYCALEGDPRTAGVCGYMSLYQQPMLNDYFQRVDEEWFGNLDALSRLCDKIFSIQKAQIFEYSFSHIFDKPFESIFGFIQVLPGAFSAYRWEALNDKDILNTYLPNDEERLKNVKQANKYLAEDRILCLELFSRKYSNYLLKYVPDAVVRVDPVVHLVLLLNQRRRWINGSWYAMEYVLDKGFFKIWGRECKHNILRKSFFTLFLLYNRVMLSISYSIVGLYFVFLDILVKEYFSKYNIFNSKSELTQISGIILFAYITLVGSMVIYSIFYKARERPEKFYMASNYLGTFMLFSFGGGIYFFLDQFFQNKNYQFFDVKLVLYQKGDKLDPRVLRMLIILNIISYVLPCLFNFKNAVCDLLFSAKDFLFFAPTYVHNLVIYAFCNVDDLTWGTKGLETDKARRAKEFREYKMKKVMIWVLFNILLAYFLLCLNSVPNYKVNFMLYCAYFYTGVLLLKSILSVVYHAKYYIFDSMRDDLAMEKKRVENILFTKVLKKNEAEFENEVCPTEPEKISKKEKLPDEFTAHSVNQKKNDKAVRFEASVKNYINTKANKTLQKSQIILSTKDYPEDFTNNVPSESEKYKNDYFRNDASIEPMPVIQKEVQPFTKKGTNISSAQKLYNSQSKSNLIEMDNLIPKEDSLAEGFVNSTHNNEEAISSTRHFRTQVSLVTVADKFANDAAKSASNFDFKGMK